MPGQIPVAERLSAISTLITQALCLADEGDELLLGAKLSDALDCVQARIETVRRDAA
ncbi:hypothetical protein QP185_02910 [Sphingomonas aerolata]|uniref:hypothetical protein n=1 Tax=Sphingomonas aerolata TaxID=185951 RepID=UPI002FE13453